jgi:hypothetical protein
MLLDPGTCNAFSYPTESISCRWGPYRPLQCRECLFKGMGHPALLANHIPARSPLCTLWVLQFCAGLPTPGGKQTTWRSKRELRWKGW